MRTIEWSNAFKRDFKRIHKGPHCKKIDLLLATVTDLLANNKPLPQKYFDHALSSNWKDHRECHLQPDLLLIYKLIEDHTLRLIRLGSHSELF
jgi:mRNA interferase YafQ